MEIIGKGAFGVVYLYTTTTGEKLAIKKENRVHRLTMYVILHIVLKYAYFLY